MGFGCTAFRSKAFLSFTLGFKNHIRERALSLNGGAFFGLLELPFRLLRWSTALMIGLNGRKACSLAISDNNDQIVWARV